MDLVQTIESFLEHRRLRGVSSGSIEVYERILFVWHRWRAKHGPSLADVSLAELRGYFSYLSREHVPHTGNRYRKPLNQRGLSPASIEQVWKVLSAFWSFAAEEGLLNPSQARFFGPSGVPRPRVMEAVRPAIDEIAINLLLAAADKHGSAEEQKRDRAIILMLAESGMRISELCGLSDEQLKLDRREADIIGKGNRPRTVFWGPRTARALTSYLEVRRGISGGPVFRGVGSRSSGGLLASSTRDMVKRRAEQAGVELPKGAPCHWFRHGFAHRLLDEGMPSLHLQQLLGHSNIKHTERYAKENPSRLRRIYSRYWREE